ncbi:MAG: hypothetical protein ABL933_02190 [Methyloglobulus sp.]
MPKNIVPFVRTCVNGALNNVPNITWIIVNVVPILAGFVPMNAEKWRHSAYAWKTAGGWQLYCFLANRHFGDLILIFIFKLYVGNNIARAESGTT